MAIIQGDNHPITLTFNADMESVQKISVSLYGAYQKNLLKHWDKRDLQIHENVVDCPLTETETAAFPEGQVEVDVKWVDEDGDYQFAKTLTTSVAHRNDRGVIFS